MVKPDCCVTARIVSQAIGNIICMELAIGDICILMTRYLQIWVAEARSWDSVSPLTPKAFSEVKFWLDYFAKNPTPQMPLIPKPVGAFIEIYTDASSTGGGAT